MFKVKLDTEPTGWEVGTPSEIGPYLLERCFSYGSPGYNTLTAIDWSQVVAITYRVPSDGSNSTPTISPREAVEALQRLGGSVPSKRAFADSLACGHTAVDRALKQLESIGVVEPFDGPRRAIGYRLTGRNLPQS